MNGRGEEIKVGDQGPIYAETRNGGFPVEPVNTVSNLVFLVIVIYWCRRTRLDFRRHPVTVFSLPILLLGFIGGTIYHATRSNDIWRLLDVFPIVLLALLASAYMWRRYFGNSLKTLLAIAIPSVAYRILAEIFAEHHLVMIGLGYGFLAFIIIAPAIIVSKSMQWRGFGDLAAAALFFSFALAFRQMDESIGAELLSCGTHFIWHLLGGVSVHFAFKFVFVVEDESSARSFQEHAELP